MIQIEKLLEVINSYPERAIFALRDWAENFEDMNVISVDKAVDMLFNGEDFYALDLNDGSEFLWDGDTDELHKMAESGDFIFAVE